MTTSPIEASFLDAQRLALSVVVLLCVGVCELFHRASLPLATSCFEDHFSGRLYPGHSYPFRVH